MFGTFELEVRRVVHNYLFNQNFRMMGHSSWFNTAGYQYRVCVSTFFLARFVMNTEHAKKKHPRQFGDVHAMACYLIA